MRNTGWQIRWLRRWDEVLDPAFMASWRALADAASEPAAFQHPDVVVPWIEEVAQPAGLEPAFALATASPTKAAGTFFGTSSAKVAGTLQVLLPAVVVAHRGRLARRRVLEPVLQDLAGYQGPLAGGDPTTVDWPGFWHEVRRSSATFCDQSRFRLVLPAHAPPELARPASDGSPVCDLPRGADLDTLLAATSANHRGDVRRRLRRLEERGPVALWLPTPATDAAALTASFDHGFVPAYQALWRPHPAGSLFDRPGVPAFLRRLATSGVGHYCALTAGGQQVGWHLGLVAQNELYWWFPTYAPSWENFSPGKVLLALLLAHGATAGWRRVHLLTGNHPYKLAWQPHDAGLQTLTWFAPNLRGQLLALYDRRRHPEDPPRD